MRVTWIAGKGALRIYVDGKEVDVLTGPRLALHLTEIARAYREQDSEVYGTSPQS